MAVSVQTPLYLKLGMWNSGNPQTAFSSTGSDVISPSMAYQYPLPSSGTDSVADMIPSYHHLPGEHSQPNSPALNKPSSPSMKNRGAATKSAKIKRSMSTPNVRGQATADAAALALSAEKRRNKLGYHRTSVACGHCRRRKIRCIPAPADPQNRCSNCIRLKKECNFYPVDQQPHQEPSRRSSKTQSGNGRASESSSPSTSSGQLPEMQNNLPYPHLNMPSIQDLGGPQMKRQRTESFSPETKVVTSSRNFEYGHGTTNWMASDASPGVKPQTEISQSYWRPNPQESPLTPAFSPFTPSLQIPPPQNWPNAHPDASPRDDLSWSVPQRSISYSNLEGLQGHPQYGAPFQHPHNQPNHNHSASDHYTTKPRTLQSGMYPPPISTSTGPHSATETPSATTSEPGQHAHSAGALPSHYPQWQQPYSYQKPVVSGSEPYGAWHNSHGAPHNLPEEGHAPPTYAYGDPAGGGYYPLPAPQHGR